MVALDNSNTTTSPSACEVEIVCALPANVILTNVFLPRSASIQADLVRGGAHIKCFSTRCSFGAANPLTLIQSVSSAR